MFGYLNYSKELNMPLKHCYPLNLLYLITYLCNSDSCSISTAVAFQPSAKLLASKAKCIQYQMKPTVTLMSCSQNTGNI